MYSLYDRVLGCLIGAAAGDAMGAATEARTTEQIISYFGHRVTDFEVTPMDTFAHGNIKGQVTDDFSSAYVIARHIIEAGGRISEDVVKEAIIEWSEVPAFFDRFAGPTTRMAVRRFKGEVIPESDRVTLMPRQATNGAAMKISPVGLFNPSDPDQAVRDSAVVTMVTHDNIPAVSGGAAIAAAAAEAVRCGADLFSVIQAGLKGAVYGESIGRELCRDVASPSVVKKIEMAVDIGLGSGTAEEKVREIADRIGTGLHVAEAVPSAFGILAANNGDPMETIISAVNAGYDTDTTATIAGAIAGALKGSGAFPDHFLPVIDSANGFDLAGTASDIVRTAVLRKSGAVSPDTDTDNTVGCSAADISYKIRGCILGAAAGDALGAPGEGKTSSLITEMYGGSADHFIDPPDDVPARGRKAGQVTDAFSIPYMVLEELIQKDNPDMEDARSAAVQALMRWGDSEYFEPFAGMTTRKAVTRLNESKQLNTWDRIGHLGNKLFKGHYYALSSNGSVVKAWPAALLSGGDVSRAIELAAGIACSSHDDVLSVSGACATAAAVCKALSSGNSDGVYEVVSAALDGARMGEALARSIPGICVYPGPSVAKRIEMAQKIALHISGGDPVRELTDRIGCGPAAAETLPLALGILIAYNGDPMKCLSAAACAGDETSAAASLAGALCGALRGADSFPADWETILDRQNNTNISEITEKVVEKCGDIW